MKRYKYKAQIQEAEYWKHLNERQVTKLLLSIQEIMGPFFPHQKDSVTLPTEKFRYLLENINRVELANTIHFFLTEANVNKKVLIYECINILCQYPYGKGTESIIDWFLMLPGIENIHYQKDGYEFITESGKITVYRASEFLGRSSRVMQLYRQFKIEDSHILLTLLAPKLPEDIIISCLFPLLFSGFSYESYLKLQKEKGLLDLVHNSFYPDNSFEDFFEPKILVKKKGKELDFEIPPLLEKAYESQRKESL